MRFALDTNVLAYAEGVNGSERRTAILQVLAEIGDDNIVLPLQALAELYHVLLKKARRPRDETARAVSIWAAGFETIDTGSAAFMDAMAINSLHQFTIFDSIILACAAQSGCQFLLSEDMHTGFEWSGCTVLNPFLPGFPELISRS